MSSVYGQVGVDRSCAPRIAAVFAALSLVLGVGVLFAVVAVCAGLYVLAARGYSRRQRWVAGASVTFSLVTTAATLLILSVHFI
jgi:hypothetical protein